MLSLNSKVKCDAWGDNIKDTQKVGLAYVTLWPSLSITLALHTFLGRSNTFVHKPTTTKHITS